MARYLLDTNHLGAALDDRFGLRSRIYEASKAGNRLGTCVPVLCELETGIAQTWHRDRNRQILTVLLRQIRIWPLEPGVAQIYAEIYHSLRAVGRVLSQVDMLLAAQARLMSAVILTTDGDFRALDPIRTENWLA